MQKDTPRFRSHISRTAAQFREQEYLKENLPPNHSTFIWILPKIIGAHRKVRSSLPIGHQLRSLSILLLCTIKRKIQKKAVTKAFVFISNESRHDAIFAYTIIGKLVPLLKEVVPNLGMVHFGPILR